jgi:hypothetical protein
MNRRQQRPDPTPRPTPNHPPRGRGIRFRLLPRWLWFAVLPRPARVSASRALDAVDLARGCPGRVARRSLVRGLRRR